MTVGRIWAFAITACAFGTAFAAAGDRVSITGGVDGSGHQYAWTITNHDASPIVGIEFSHFRGDILTAPKGWTGNLENHNSPDGKTGRCTAVADRPDLGIAKGASTAVTLRIGRRVAIAGSGDMTLRFADGSEEVVQVALPVRGSTVQRYTTPIGFGVVLAIGLGARRIRRRRREAQRPEAKPS